MTEQSTRKDLAPHGKRALDALLLEMRPQRRTGRFVFVTVPTVLEGVESVASVWEPEGLSLVLEQAEADRLGLDYEFVAAMITLGVHSALDAVGLTAAVARALADADMSCNVVAGRFHDHLFVPVERAHEALGLLAALSTSSQE
jgi:hypothetical protein